MALDFIVIGAQRAGTTWLFTRLSMNPRIYFPLGKEINFWNNLAEYEASNPFMIQLYNRRFTPQSIGSEDDFRLGDICPQYSIMDEYAINKLYARFPGVAVIYVLRNPILRSFSARRFSVTRGKKGPEFLEPDKIANLYAPDAKLPQGDYAANIRRWTKVAESRGLPPPRLMFYDDILRDPVHFLKDVGAFIGIDGGFYDNLPRDVVAERVNTARGSGFPPSVYPQALAYYGPMIEELQALSGRDLSGWLNADDPSEFSQPV